MLPEKIASFEDNVDELDWHDMLYTPHATILICTLPFSISLPCS